MYEMEQIGKTDGFQPQGVEYMDSLSADHTSVRFLRPLTDLFIPL
jgi:hypothetical protein